MLEADLLSSLDHKNIVKNLEVDQTEDYIFFVMELISRFLLFFCFLCLCGFIFCFQSGSLYETLQKFGTLTEQLCVIYIVQVLRGLRYLHGKGLVHGDIVRNFFVWRVSAFPLTVLVLFPLF
jgi:serine/threonine protein kinase